MDFEARVEANVDEFNSLLDELFDPKSRSRQDRIAALDELKAFQNELRFNDLVRRVSAGTLDEDLDAIDELLDPLGFSRADLRRAVQRSQCP